MSKQRHSIRNKIIIWAMGFALFLALSVAFLSYVLSMRYLKENQQQSALTNIHVLGNELDSHIGSVLTFSNWICLDSTLSNYLSTVESAYSKDPHSGKKLSLSAWNHLNNEFNIIGARNYVDRVLISTPGGSRYLQSISSGTAQGVVNGPITIMDTGFFDEFVTSHTQKWVGPLDNPLTKSGNPRVLPVIRPIYSSSSSIVIGWVYLDIPERVITGALKSFVLAGDDALFLTFSPGQSYRFDGSALIKESVPKNVISYTLPDTDWVISYLPSEKALTRRMHFYKLMILLIVAVILFAGVVLSFILQRTITRPVGLLIKRLGRIGQGDFSRDASLEWNNELGEIGKGINSLSENVSELMEKRLQDEQSRHELEYQVLQSQINPHFLYNTLNTIKWMATIQGSEGIADMSTSLSRLMKNISKSTEDLISVRDEFALVDDYFTIMKYRYGGTIELEYITDDETLLDVRINRFSLQPIVENAIFHGIEPKGSAGKITIHLYQSGASAVIDVTDNGVGMTSEAIAQVLSGEGQADTEFFRQIGVYNVNERIKYTFGDDYGITIESEPGVYTTMRFTLPSGSR
ncbi:MAG: sensor histidine kinase [Butyrivibrio sp.]|nr:sensor histidine kinase [Butyrivibrio sp.]